MKILLILDDIDYVLKNRFLHINCFNVDEI